MTEVWNVSRRSQEPAEIIDPNDAWVSLRIGRLIRLGASVEELARETIESILGYQGEGGHKPPRPDIQKMKDAYHLWAMANGAAKYDREDLADPSLNDAAAQEWGEKYGLNSTEVQIVREYQNSYQVLDHDPQRAFAQTLRKLRADNTLGLHALDDSELKKLVGTALKKYEQQNWPMLYKTIEYALDDAYSSGPLESYKMWPRLVSWIKDYYQTWLFEHNHTFNSDNQSHNNIYGVVRHFVDIATEGGAVLDQLRRENRLPQNFDINKISFEDFEKWLMDWKRENRQAESQGQVVYEFKDGWTIQKLTTPEQLQFEGDEMGHCVGGYSHAVGGGEVIIYSLRDPKGMPHVTMEVNALEGAPSYGFANREEPPEDAAYNYEYIHPDKDAPGDHMESGVSSREPAYRPTGETPFAVVQVQGNSNNTPKPEYQRKIKEFLDYLRSKGWKFERSPNWFHNYDDPRADNEWADSIYHAEDLDDWYDNHYKTHYKEYQGGGEDVYGLPNERSALGISWDDWFQRAVEELTGDRGRGDWKGLAQAVYHAWMIDIYKDHLDEQGLERQKKNLIQQITDSQAKLDDWDNEYEDNYWEHIGQLQYEKFEALAQAKGVWNEIYDKANELFEEAPYRVGGLEAEIANIAADEHSDLWYEARDAARDELLDAYSGDARQFLHYLYLLVDHHGAVNPGDLPDPNERHGGLTSYEDLKQQQEELWRRQREIQEQTPTLDLTNGVEQGLPGALSKLAGYDANDPAPIGSLWLWPERGNKWFSEAAPGRPAGYRRVRIVDSPEQVSQQIGGPLDGATNYITTGPYAMDDLVHMVDDERPDTYLGWIPKTEWLPRYVQTGRVKPYIPDSPDDWRLAASSEIQIHPIDQEHNVWFDEDGNEHVRYRRGWAKSPETGRMEQTGALEDTFLDKQGRQGQGVVAYHGENPVGSVTWVEDPNGWNMLGTAFVHPDYREQGLFSRMTAPLRESGRPTDAYVWNNGWLKQKVRGWPSNRP